jgi:predicted amidohydrolase YtcJ
LEKQLGTIAQGFEADMVVLSANPLSVEDHPDDLHSIRVLTTVHRGIYKQNPHPNETPIWPE